MVKNIRIDINFVIFKYLTVIHGNMNNPKSVRLFCKTCRCEGERGAGWEQKRRRHYR